MAHESMATKPAAAAPTSEGGNYTLPVATDNTSNNATVAPAASSVGGASSSLPAPPPLASTNPSSAAMQRIPAVHKQSNFASVQGGGPADVTFPSYSTTTMPYNNAMSNMNLVKQTEEQELLDMIEKGYGSGGRTNVDPSNPLAALTSHRKKSTPADAVRIDPWDMLKHIDHYDIQEFNAWELAREINWNYRELLFEGTGKNVYLDACSFLGVIPNSSFVRALEQTTRERNQSSSTTASSQGGAADSTTSKQQPQSTASVMNNNNNKKYQMNKLSTNIVHDEQHITSTTNSGSPFEVNGLEIDLSSSGLNDVACRAICIGIVNNTSITSLKLADNTVGPIGADYIQQLFRTNLYIVDIDLSNNQLGHEGCRYVCYYLLTKKCHMRVLRTARNQWGDREIPLVAAAMERNRSLLLWDLSHNGFTEKCGQLFGAALGENDTLIELDLSWNRIRGRGFAAFWPGFKNNVRLTTLRLAFNDLGDRATMLFADALKTKSNLTHVDLSSCNINLIAVERFLIKVLPACEELRILKLGHNPITHQGAYSLLTVCAESTHIELLDLSGITIQPKFINYLKASEPKRPFKVLHGLPMVLNGPIPPQPKMVAPGGGGKKKDKKRK